jgi:signal transduction histidine kinase
MRWPPTALRARVLGTHLLVAAASTLALLVSIFLLAPFLFSTLPQGNGPVLAALAITAAVALGGGAAALLAARWLTGQITVPVGRASWLARRLTRGHYSDRIASGGSISSSHNDALSSLVASLDDLATSLEAAERRRMESFGEITHELRTPVAVLEGYFEGLLDGHVKPSDETWAMLYDEASRVHRLVDELQALSRAEARRVPPDLQSVHPGGIARAALDRLRLHFDEKGLQVVAEIPEGLPPILADPDHAIQVLVNLLTNALRYTPVPGVVTLSVNRLVERAGTGASNEVIFRVSDTGVGIAAEHVPHLFERFFRVDRSSSRAGGGSGIGLPVAKALVEAMGGRIWAESPGLGKGSTFSFTLLVSAEPA